MWPAGSTGHPAPPSGCPSSRGPDGVKTAPKRQEFSDIGADSDRELPLKNSGRCRGANGVTRGRAPRPPQGRAHTSSTGSPKTPCERSSSYAPPRTKFCLYRCLAMPSGRATACSDCHQSTVSCAVLCAPFRAHLTRLTRHHVTLSRPVRFRWQPVRPWRCSGPGQLPSHRPGGAAACRVRRQHAGNTGVLPSQGHAAGRAL